MGEVRGSSPRIPISMFENLLESVKKTVKALRNGNISQAISEIREMLRVVERETEDEGENNEP